METLYFGANSSAVVHNQMFGCEQLRFQFYSASGSQHLQPNVCCQWNELSLATNHLVTNNRSVIVQLKLHPKLKVENPVWNIQPLLFVFLLDLKIKKYNKAFSTNMLTLVYRLPSKRAFPPGRRLKWYILWLVLSWFLLKLNIIRYY